MTDNKAAIKQILKINNGIVTTTQVTEAGIPRRCLSTMVDSGIIYRVERGIYALPEVWKDEMFFMQYHFSKGIFSHETALYLHDMTDRIPIRYTMTFPFGYNTGSVKKQGIIAKLSTEETYHRDVIYNVSNSIGYAVRSVLVKHYKIDAYILHS